MHHWFKKQQLCLDDLTFVRPCSPCGSGSACSWLSFSSAAPLSFLGVLVWVTLKSAELGAVIQGWTLQRKWDLSHLSPLLLLFQPGVGDPFADAVQLYQIMCQVKPYLLCPSAVTNDTDGCKLKVALYIGELNCNDSAFVSILSRTPNWWYVGKHFSKPQYFFYFWREVELRCY